MYGSTPELIISTPYYYTPRLLVMVYPFARKWRVMCVDFGRRRQNPQSCGSHDPICMDDVGSRLPIICVPGILYIPDQNHYIYTPILLLLLTDIIHDGRHQNSLYWYDWKKCVRLMFNFPVSSKDLCELTCWLGRTILFIFHYSLPTWTRPLNSPSS